MTQAFAISGVVKTSSEGRTVRVEYGGITAPENALVVYKSGIGVVCLFCKECSWCSHIAHLARNRMDHNLYDAAGDTIEADTPKRCDYLVPVVPTEGIFIPITTAIEGTDDPFTKIMLTNRIVGSEIDEQVDVCIGVLPSAQFGTKEIRSLVTDYFSGNFDNARYFFQPDIEARNRMGDDGISHFSSSVYYAIFGKTFKQLNSKGNAAKDAPTF